MSKDCCFINPAEGNSCDRPGLIFGEEIVGKQKTKLTEWTSAGG
jgi:hypothetical protein